jgi:hypothetical protein
MVYLADKNVVNAIVSFEGSSYSIRLTPVEDPEPAIRCWRFDGSAIPQLTPI